MRPVFICNRLKLEQTKQINELREKLQSKETELEKLHNRSRDLDEDLKVAHQYNGNLRVQVDNIEAQLNNVHKELASRTKFVDQKKEEVSLLESKLQDLSNYVDDFNELKKRIVTLSRNYEDDKKRSSEHSLDSTKQNNLKERKLELLKQKIERKKEIIEKNRILHQSRVRKLKRDKDMLEAVSAFYALKPCTS